LASAFHTRSKKNDFHASERLRVSRCTRYTEDCQQRENNMTKMEKNLKVDPLCAWF
jgi:hypothetical protein